MYDAVVKPLRPSWPGCQPVTKHISDAKETKGKKWEESNTDTDLDESSSGKLMTFSGQVWTPRDISKH